MKLGPPFGGPFDSSAKKMPKPRGATKRKSKKGEGDWWAPEPWAVDALVDKEEFEGQVWECACGDGRLSRRLQHHGLDVVSSDLYDRGFGEREDFLRSERRATIVITNPPFDIDEAFILKALQLATAKAAMLLRLEFLSGIERDNQIFENRHQPGYWCVPNA